MQLWKGFGRVACIEREDFDAYFSGVRYSYAILLYQVKKFQKQVCASDRAKKFGFVPAQSFRYLDERCSLLLQNERRLGGWRISRGSRFPSPERARLQKRPLRGVRGEALDKGLISDDTAAALFACSRGELEAAVGSTRNLVSQKEVS